MAGCHDFLVRGLAMLSERSGPLAAARLAIARARIAAAVLPPRLHPRVGQVTLRDDQAVLAGIVARKLERHGGCLLAEDVGRGKTVIALAVARDAPSTLVVAPASLRAMWTDAMARTGVRGAVVSHEALSRRHSGAEHADLVVVDESHRFRNTRTARHAALTRLCARSRVLLLSATPVHNRLGDLAAQLALFLGSRAQADAGELAALHVVRGVDADVGLPRVSAPESLTLACDDRHVLDGILGLPAPPRPADGGDAGILRTIALVRAWSSSRAALGTVLASRRRVVTAIAQCLDEGRVPSRRDIRAWESVGADVQLTLASLLAEAVPRASDSARLRALVNAEGAALDQLASLMARSADPDVARAALVVQLRARHGGGSIIAFTEWASTARRYFQLLRHQAGVGLLTASRAEIASGRVTRPELLDRFAPRSRGAREPPDHSRVTLLLATDLLSEGVNLQDASVVVHLDLPWNPQRMAQRVGRIRRLGGATEVRAYVLAPPADGERLLDVQQRLRVKLRLSAQVVGRGIPVLPTLVLSRTEDESPRAPTPPETAALIADAVDGWLCRNPREGRRHLATGAIAACHADVSGWLACLDDGSLMASLEGAVSNAPAHLLRAITLANGTPRFVRPGERALATDAQRDWMEREATADALGASTPSTTLQRLVDRVVRRALARSERHDRVRLTRDAALLRDVLASPVPLGVERAMLEALEDHSGASDGALLLRKLASLLTHDRSTASGASRDQALVAMILFGAP